MGLIPSYKSVFALLIILIFFACSRSPAGNNQENENAEEVPVNVETKAASSPAAEEEMRQAALEGDGENVNKLLEAGTQVNAMDQDGHTALMYAAFNGHSKIVLALLENGAGVDRRDLMGRTALLYASTGPFPETVKILLEKGAKPNIIDSDEHFTPLMHAAAEGNLDVVKILLEYEADLSLTDVDGDDAESFARQAGHIQVADYLKSVR